MLNDISASNTNDTTDTPASCSNSTTTATSVLFEALLLSYNNMTTTNTALDQNIE